MTALEPSGDTSTIESERLAAAKGGDLAAFEWLYRSYVRQVYGTCLRLTDRAQDAEDFTQRVFVRAWRRLESFRGDSPLGPWLRSIAVRLMIDERRSRWREDLATVEHDREFEDPAPRRVSDAVIDLERALRTLPPGARRVLVLHDIEGLTHREIAGRLGVSVGTTKTQLFRARRALKERLQ